MKKTVTIFLLALMLFNMAGYRLVFSFLESLETEKLDARIDAGDYSEAGLIELKIPLKIPYQERNTDFERHYGEITVDNILYTYVKMKINGDTLILKCIPNSGRQQLKLTAIGFTRASSGQDMDHTGKKDYSSFSKSLSGDYDDKNTGWDLANNEYPASLQRIDHTDALHHAPIKTPHQPPRC